VLEIPDPDSSLHRSFHAKTYGPAKCLSISKKSVQSGFALTRICPADTPSVTQTQFEIRPGNQSPRRAKTSFQVSRSQGFKAKWGTKMPGLSAGHLGILGNERAPDDYLLFSSPAITPSLIKMTRWAYSAMSCSCVTRTIVFPSACRRSSTAMISLPVCESRFR